ncbi:NUDIX domain-containing protein [Flavobacterium circumlabens]|uniref:NUDIX domain-containing protein n=1 Tax=Flavobacterium circumlabens TaxID=2133765 RepID=A0A4Y7U9B2_9FLAO|nr:MULTISPECIES: NUDIX domain-containing protein [Flavobacterium]QSB28937.1 NUDIX domain-containing protein [Flavobacterium sp. CLA17]TCN54626.1 putative NUDIX family NTP pyrophosphohydrolase [Flavobacterium circumlabens]TEB42821.1 NUDIX domain-containing protein [Flavobacterium circumlabens]
MKQSAGILLYKFIDKTIYFLLVHPGGPFWKNKDLESWSIPKGEFSADEDPLLAAKREFKEETGFELEGESDDFIVLESVKLKSGKMVFAWALEFDIDVTLVKSNEFEMEWPPKSGTINNFPEIDKAEWFQTDEALQKVNPAQADFIIQIVSKISSSL